MLRIASIVGKFCILLGCIAGIIYAGLIRNPIIGLSILGFFIMYCMYIDVQNKLWIAQNLFKELREDWFNANLKSDLKSIYDADTHELLDGRKRAVSPISKDDIGETEIVIGGNTFRRE